MNTKSSLILSFLSHQLKSSFPSDLLTSRVLNSILLSGELVAVDTIKCLSHWKDFLGIQALDPVNSRQYATFLVLLSASLYQQGLQLESDLVACLNKIVSGCEIFGHLPLSPNFLLGHTLGIVLGRAEYGDYLCIQHNVTVGRWGDDIPKIGDRVMILNGAAVVGASVVGDNSIISTGVRVVNQIVPQNSIAFAGSAGKLIFKPNAKNYINQWLLNCDQESSLVGQ